MINNDKADSEQEKLENSKEQFPTPDEDSGIIVQSFLKIFDPESGEVLVRGRS